MVALKTASYLCLLLLCVTVFRVNADAEPLVLNVTQDGEYTISRNDGTVWLRSAPTFFIINNVKYSAADKTLTLLGVNKTSDEGYFKYTLTYMANHTEILAVMHDLPGLRAVGFTVTFPDGANNTTAASPDSVICGFPGFRVDPAPARFAYMSYGLSSLEAASGRWENGSAMVYGGRQGSGPLVLFDKNNKAVAMGPASRFTVTSLWHDVEHASIYWGIMGGVTHLPAGFKYDVEVNDGDGIGAAVGSWATIVRGNFFRDAQDVLSAAVSENTLGYWTGPGSAYYSAPEAGKTYEQTLIDVKNDTGSDTPRDPRVDYRHVEIDDWWYEKGQGGVKTWSAPSTVFPDGVKGLAEKTQWQIAAACGVWAHDTTYAKQNGGSFTFLMGQNCSLPNDQAFWDSLFNDPANSQIRIFVQKAMEQQYLCMTSGASDVDTVATWLSQMNVSAVQRNMEVMYSGALPRLVTEASVQLTVSPAVKVGAEVVTKDNLWKVGVANIFIAALRLRPFFGITRSYGNESDSTLSPQLYNLLATLTGGHVAVGDPIGQSDRQLIERCCSATGSVLSPNVPAKAIDDQLRQRAWGGDVGSTGDIWTTFTSTKLNKDEEPTVFNGIIMSTGLTRPYAITPSSAGFSSFADGKKLYLYSYLDPYILHDFSDQKSFTLSNCSGRDFCLYHVATVLTFKGKEAVVMGDLTKWVPMSPQRVDHIEVNDKIMIHTLGKPQERVFMWLHIDGRLHALEHRIGADGTGIVEYILPSSSAPRNTIVNHVIILCAGLFVYMMVSQVIGQPFALHYIHRAHRRGILEGCLKAYAQSPCAGEVLKSVQV